jgi:transposase
MAQIEVISGVDRHRRWTLEEKQAHVARAFAPGVKVKAYARQADMATSLLYDWRKTLRCETASNNGFMSVVAVTDNEGSTSGLFRSAREPAIELEVRGHKVRVPGNIPASLAIAVIQAPTLTLHI